MELKGLIESYDIPERYGFLFRQISALVEHSGFQEYVRIDEDLLGKAVTDYFEDTDRLKRFEGIKHTSVSKIYAYQIYWILKRKPIQIIKQGINEEKCLYLNEIVCASMIISSMYKELGLNPPEGSERVKRFYDLLYYNFKYREYNQKSLELMIEAFFLGADASKK